MYTRRCQNLRGTARESFRKNRKNGDLVCSDLSKLSTDLLHERMYRTKEYLTHWRQARLLLVLVTQALAITGKQDVVALALTKSRPQHGQTISFTERSKTAAKPKTATRAKKKRSSLHLRSSLYDPFIHHKLVPIDITPQWPSGMPALSSCSPPQKPAKNWRQKTNRDGWWSSALWMDVSRVWQHLQS